MIGGFVIEGKKNNWLGRNLNSYKSMQSNVARKKGCYEELMRASTLTEARKIVYGYKKKNLK